VNIPGDALAIGGGRDLTITGNVIINPGEGISYDERARDGAKHSDEPGWFTHSYEDGEMWHWLWASPWQSEAWKAAFPQYQHYSQDYSDFDSPDFFPNPAYSIVANNTVLRSNTLGNIRESVYRFSTVENNRAKFLGKLKGIYDSALAASIPLEEIGRVDW
jgi:hypothetical protein